MTSRDLIGLQAMKEQIQEMESELERFHKQNTQLELNITELRQKLKATDKELHQERQRVRSAIYASPLSSCSQQ